MAVINSLVFNERQGTIIADEEYWFLRRRKSFFADNLHEILDSEIANDLDLEVVYSGVGHPSFHHEVAEKTRKTVRDRWKAWKKDGGPKPFETVEQIGHLIIEWTQKTIRRRVDEKLRYFYGFDTDDYNRGSFKDHDGKSVTIGQDKVKGAAKGLIQFTEKTPPNKAIYENIAVVLGWDAVRGMGNYHIKAENCVLSVVSGRFESVGKGMYASAMTLTHYLGNKTLAERMVGIDRLEGTVELIKATLQAQEYFQEAGGQMSLIAIDGEKKSHDSRIRLVTDDTMHLAVEVVRALGAGLIPRPTALTMVNDLVYGSGAVDAVENRLFKAANDPKRLEYLLRGYKVQDWLDSDFGLPAAPKTHRQTKGK